MSDPIWIALILALTLLGMTGILAYAWWKISALEAPQALPEPSPEPVERYKSSPMPEYEYSKTTVEDSALKVDPARLPSKKIYRPQPGSTALPPRCVCHGKEVQQGQEVIMWPVLGSKEVKVFCVDALQ